MTPDGVELTVQSEGKQSQPSLLMMDWGPTLGAVRRRFQDIARAEFRKQRKRLGVLSAEQEAAIEALLITTVNNISHRALAQMRRLIETSAETASAITEVVLDMARAANG
jgi:glutamyl-tRNA reductase